ncbi:MAG: hypothetical protein A2Z34_06015 [Planctomycetes bacterium RBG_16_59_8]|nr:MAG: hypothetical protein A2Z34_06015 [Planctomycetes bacterium RBG_16_59_8]
MNSVGTKLTLTFSFFGLLILALLLLASSIFNRIEKEIPSMILVEKQSTAVMNLLNTTIQYIQTGEAEDRRNVLQIIDQWEANHTVIRDGGDAVIHGDRTVVRPIEEEEIRSLLRVERQHWENIRKRIQTMLVQRDAMNEALNRYARAKPIMIENAQRLSDALEATGPQWEPSAKLCESLTPHIEKLNGAMTTMVALRSGDDAALASSLATSLDESLQLIDNIIRWIGAGNDELAIPPLELPEAIREHEKLLSISTVVNGEVRRIADLWNDLLPAKSPLDTQCLRAIDRTGKVQEAMIRASNRRMESINRISWGMFVFAIILTLFFITIARFTLSLPLRQLSRATKKVAGGELDVELTAGGNDEVGTLVANFQQMTRKLKEMHAQLVQTAKLSSLGTMTAGIAHELNNPLTSVLGYTQLLLMRNDLDPKLRDILEKIGREGDRCRKIVQQMLQYSRQETGAKTPCDIDKIVAETIALLREEMGHSWVVLDVRLAERPAIVLGDSVQLHQVFFNLIDNAFDALREVDRERRRLEIATQNDGELLRVIVRDTGPGIPKKALEKVFDPFFTTKQVGKGTGLGLSIAYGIVKDHKGSIRIESDEGKGTTAIVELPLLPPESKSPV